MAEWFKAAVLKTAEVKASVGSNPTLSVYLLYTNNYSIKGDCVYGKMSSVRYNNRRWNC